MESPGPERRKDGFTQSGAFHWSWLNNDCSPFFAQECFRSFRISLICRKDQILLIDDERERPSASQLSSDQRLFTARFSHGKMFRGRTYCNPFFAHAPKTPLYLFTCRPCRIDPEISRLFWAERGTACSALRNRPILRQLPRPWATSQFDIDWPTEPTWLLSRTLGFSGCFTRPAGDDQASVFCQPASPRLYWPTKGTGGFSVRVSLDRYLQTIFGRDASSRKRPCWRSQALLR